MSRFFLSLVVVFASTVAAFGQATWKSYANARFGLVLHYPGTLVASREPDNGAGREFHTADKEFSVLAQAHFLNTEDGDSLQKRWKEELAQLGDTVTYKKLGSTWYVVSGVAKDGAEYYRKFFTKGSNWAEFSITYPHAKNRKYDPWVEGIAKRFVPFRDGDFDTR